MDPISENPVLNPKAASKLQFQEITPEIPALPPPPPEIPEVEEGVSQEAAGDKRPPGRPRGTRSSTPATRQPGRHRKPEDDKPDEPKPPAPPKVKPPDFREWHDFGANFVFKWLCRGYVGWVFQGIDRERVLNAAELKALDPDPEMLSAATKPLAHMADRSKFMTKHGRAIIDSADGIEALIAVGMYANTVRRIAKSHAADRQPSQGKKKKDVRIVDGPRIREPVREQSGGSDVAEEPRHIRVVNGESGFGNAGFGVGG